MPNLIDYLKSNSYVQPEISAGGPGSGPQGGNALGSIATQHGYKQNAVIPQYYEHANGHSLRVNEDSGNWLHDDADREKQKMGSGAGKLDSFLTKFHSKVG